MHIQLELSTVTSLSNLVILLAATKMGQMVARLWYVKEQKKRPLISLKEREVKKANRELNNLTSKMDDLQKIETLQKRVTEHLADMKRLERENLKNKKRGDMLQKEKDHARAELSKSMTLKEKLEKLCRELQRENNRLKVRSGGRVPVIFHFGALTSLA
jgi:predicted RNase H-like nuclease (RuvC/YqgF family)